MRLTRRAFTTVSMGSIAGCWLAGPLGVRVLGAQPADRPEKTLFDWSQPKKGIFVAVGAGGNVLVALGESSAMVVDCKHAGYGAALRKEAEMLGRPIRHVVNTHHHADHTGGNPSFTSMSGVEVIAHPKVSERVLAQAQRYEQSARNAIRELQGSDAPTAKASLEEVEALIATLESGDAKEFVPTRSMSGASGTVDVSGVEVQLFHRGAGHTDNDVYVFIPEWNVLHTGDLFFHKLHPFMDVGAGANSKGWQESVRAMLELCDENTIVIPGHGDVTDPVALRGQSEYFDTMRRIVMHAKDVEGMSREEVVQMKPSAFEGYGFAQMLERNLGVIYDELGADAK